MEARGSENFREREKKDCFLWLLVLQMCLPDSRFRAQPGWVWHCPWSCLHPQPQFISHAISIPKGSSLCYQVHSALSTPCTAPGRNSAAHTMLWLWTGRNAGWECSRWNGRGKKALAQLYEVQLACGCLEAENWQHDELSKCIVQSRSQ